MFRKWNRILAFLLSIALVTTTFGSDFASAKVYAEEIETEENTDENSEEDYEEESEEDDEESEEDDEESTIADLPADEEIPQNASGDGNGEGSGNSGNGEFIPEDGQNGENGAPASEDVDDLSKYLLDEDGNVVLDEFGNPVLKEQPVEEETEEEVVEAEEEIDGIKIYYVVSDEDAGSVDNDSDVFAEGKEISGSTAEANEGYKFTYWTDEDGKKVSYKEKFTPSASDLGLSEESEDEESEDGEEEVTEVTFTANFEVEEATEATFDDEVREQIEIDGVLITFYAKPGVLPDDAKFDVKIVESEAEEEIKENLQDVINSETEDEVEVEVKETVSFDINIYSELSKTEDNPEGLVEPKEGDVRVTFEHISEVASTAGDVDTGLAVYHVDGSEVEYQDHDKVSKEDNITFDAEHFSIYAVVIYTSNQLSNTYSFNAKTVELKNGKFSDITSSNITRVQFEVNKQGEKVYPTSLKKEISNYSFVGAFVDVNTEIDYFSVQKDGNKYYPYYRTKNGNYEWCDDETIYFVYSSGTALATTGTVVVAVRNDGKIPSEPSIQGDYYTYIGEGEGGGKKNVTLSTIFNPITTDKTGYTNGKRVDAVVGAEAVEGRLQPGFYDLFPERFSYSINGQWKTFNPDTQYVDWYVIKYQYSDEKWHIDGVVRDKAKVALDYEENIPADATSYSGLIPDGKQYAPNTRVTVERLPSSNPLTVEGYTFDGWNTQKNGSGTAYKAGDTIKLNNSVTLYAQWKPQTYKVQFNLNGHGTGTIAEQDVQYGKKATRPTPDPTDTNYEFVGWYKDAEGTTAWNFTTDTVKTNPTILYAKWTPKTYKVTFNLNGHGTGKPQDQDVQYGNKATKPTTDPTDQNYTFVGWYKDSEGTTAWNFGTDTVKTNPTTIYAKWTPKKYNVTYDGNGATGGETKSQQFDFGKSVNIRENGFEKTGYLFKGWNTQKDGKGTSYAVNQPYSDGKDLNLYAQWSEEKYTISYDLNGGKLKDNEKNPVEYYVTSANITLINPTRPGYTFTGWSGTGLEGSANTTVTIPTGSTGDRKYSAHWIIDAGQKYTVTYEAQKNSEGKPMGQVTPGSEQAQKLGIVGLEGSEAAANDGYKFNGWAKKNGQKLEPISGTESSTKLEPTVFESYLNKDADGLNADTTFVALFAEDEGQTYTVKYELQIENGAEPKVTPFGKLTDTLNQNIQVLKTTGVTGSTASAENGYSFVGWYKRNANGGLSELTEKVEGAALSNAKAIANLNKKKSGVYDDTTFVAVFKEDQNETYTVTYQSADTSKGTVSPSQQSEQVFYARRDKLTGSTVTVIANTGYTFDGWYKINADGTATLVKDATETLTYEKLLPSLNKVGSYYSDTTFEARFKADTNQTYDVLFEAVNGKVDKTEVKGIQVLETTGIADVTASAYEGYTFDGWYVVDSNGKEKKIPNTNAKITASQIIEKLNHKSASVYDNTKFRAKFVIDDEQTYTVSYEAQKTDSGEAMGTVQPESESDQKLSTDKLKGSKAKAGDAYNFIGWYKVNNGQEDTFVSKELKLSQDDIVKCLNSHKDQDSGKVVYDDTAFIAKFEIKTFEITYKWMNGAKVDTKTVNYGEFTPIPAELTDSFDKPEAPEGYYFVEWKDKKNNKTVDKKTLVAKQVYEAATYEAVYEQKTTLALTFGSDVDSLEKYYDNEPISAKISASNLKRNHKLEVTYNATVEENGNTSVLTNQESISIKNVSSATYGIATWKVMDGTKNVSEQYTLSAESKETTATLKVNPIPIVIKAGSASKARFDGNALTNDAYTITLNPEYNVPASSKSIFNEQIKVDPATGIKNVVVEGTITLPGSEPNKIKDYEFDGNALEQNYDVKTVDGELKIGEGDPVEIVIEINANGEENREVVYDGQPHTVYADVDVNANVTTNENPITKFFEETVIPAAQNVLGIFVIRAAAAEDTDPGKLPEKTFAYGDLTIKVNGLEVVPAEGINVDKYPIKLDTSNLKITADIGGKKDVDVKGLFNITIKSPDESASGNVTTIGYMNITPAPVTVTANSFSRNTAQSDPTLTAAVVPENKNLQADAEEHISYTISRASGNGVGTYAITVTPPADAEKLEDGTYLQGNFKVTYVPGTLTISQAPSGDDDDDDTPSGGDTTIPDAPVALAPSGAVLGAQRVDGDGPAVLGARRAGTDDETNRMARVFAMVAAAAIAVTMMITGKKKDEEEEG